jgi:hypothetical protein
LLFLFCGKRCGTKQRDNEGSCDQDRRGSRLLPLVLFLVLFFLVVLIFLVDVIIFFVVVFIDIGQLFDFERVGPYNGYFRAALLTGKLVAFVEFVFFKRPSLRRKLDSSPSALPPQVDKYRSEHPHCTHAIAASYQYLTVVIIHAISASYRRGGVEPCGMPLQIGGRCRDESFLHVAVSFDHFSQVKRGESRHPAVGQWLSCVLAQRDQVGVIDGHDLLSDVVGLLDLELYIDRVTVADRDRILLPAELHLPDTSVRIGRFETAIVLHSGLS